MKGHIYLIHAKGTNLYKIGLTTRSVEARLKELNGKQSPHELILRHSVEVSEVRAAERHFHDRYRSHNYRNEWFEFSTLKVFEVVRSMNSYGKSYSSIFMPLLICSIAISLTNIAIQHRESPNCLFGREFCRK